MHNKIIEFNLAQRNKSVPELRSGDVVKIHRRITEAGKERIQIFEGIIISIKGKQSSSPTLTVRKVSDGVGVELILPLFSPIIEKIILVKRAGVRQAKLYYIRHKSAKSLKLKYTDMAPFVMPEKTVEEKSGTEPAPEESAPVAEKKPEKTPAKE